VTNVQHEEVNFLTGMSNVQNEEVDILNGVTNVQNEDPDIMSSGTKTILLVEVDVLNDLWDGMSNNW
jgi:hypothetical protein